MQNKKYCSHFSLTWIVDIHKFMLTNAPKIAIKFIANYMNVQQVCTLQPNTFETQTNQH